MFCLPREFAKKFINSLKDGTIDPAKLILMSSEERRTFLEKIVGKDAQEVNALLESKLLLKDQKRGLVTWAKKVAGISEPVRRDIITRIEKMSELLTPQTEQAFLSDLVAKKLGYEVTMEEAKKIFELSKGVQDAKAIDPHSIEYGRKVLDLQEYVQSLTPSLKDIGANIANIPKTAMTTLDFSASFRQLWGMISRPEFYKAFPKQFQYFFSKNAYRDLQASIIADPLYDTARASGLRMSLIADKLSGREEAYMTTLLNRVPGIAGAERAYVGLLNKVRFDVFKHLVRNADLAGENISRGSQVTKDLANVINDFTGSGNIGIGDKLSGSVPYLNATLFSPRKISATVNMLNPVRYLDPRISPTARKAALRQLIGSLAITTTVLALAKASGAKVETDSNSSDFGKIVRGKTRFEVTGGNATYAVLLSRLIQNKSKSSTSGKTSVFGKGYRPMTRGELMIDFARNKFSPIASMIADWAYGTNSIGKPFDVKQELLNRVTPLIVSDVTQLLQTDKSNVLYGAIGDLFGVGVQSY